MSAVLAAAMAACGDPVAIQRAAAPTAPAETVAEFRVTDQRGREVALSAALERGPVVLVFYRGHW